MAFSSRRFLMAQLHTTSWPSMWLGLLQTSHTELLLTLRRTCILPVQLHHGSRRFFMAQLQTPFQTNQFPAPLPTCILPVQLHHSLQLAPLHGDLLMP